MFWKTVFLCSFIGMIPAEAPVCVWSKGFDEMFLLHLQHHMQLSQFLVRHQGHLSLLLRMLHLMR